MLHGLELGFSAGVMVLLSFMELLTYGIETVGFAPAYLAFFVWVLIMFLLDILIPHQYLAERTALGRGNRSVCKMGLLVALGIAVHNFPEGMGTLIGTLQGLSLGAAIAAAIALHNIPEGLACLASVCRYRQSEGCFLVVLPRWGYGASRCARGRDCIAPLLEQ